MKIFGPENWKQNVVVLREESRKGGALVGEFGL